MFLDASAIVAILVKEPDWEALGKKAEGSDRKLVSALAIYEAVLGIARKLNCDFSEAQKSVHGFLREADATTIEIDAAIGAEAVSAFARFGKGQHRASLNMGDCFAYACARSRKVPLLFKGGNFIHTDIVPA